MNKIYIPLILAFLSFFLSGCGSGSKVAGPCSSESSIKFRIMSVKEGLPLDSLYLTIEIGKNGVEQKFAVNLKTGVSSANITATQGQPYKLSFQLFSAGHKIGSGSASDKIECGLDVELNPSWDLIETEKAKTELNQGALLPITLTVFFTQTLAGQIMELPLDSLSQGLYRWYIKPVKEGEINLASENLLEGEGSIVRFLVPDSLAGKTMGIRLQVVDAGKIKEERLWKISVLAALSKEKISKITIRVDSTDKFGASQVFTYADDRIALVQYFDTLTPLKNQIPSGLDSLSYDEKGRLTKKVSLFSDSTRIDSSFTYNAEGLLYMLEYRKGNDIVTDSLTYKAGKLFAAFRIVGGKIVKRTQFNWMGERKRLDSVFTIDADGDKCKGIIENTYKNDSLVERKKFGGRGELEAISTEIIAYNALGSRAYREQYSAGISLTLELSETYKYDIQGRLNSLLIKDEVTGNNLTYYKYEYTLSPLAKAAASWATHSSKGYPNALASVLTDISVAYSSLDFDVKPSLFSKGIKK